MDTLTESLDNSEIVIALFIDLSKAFDTVNVHKLINKIQNSNIPNHTKIRGKLSER